MPANVAKLIDSSTAYSESGQSDQVNGSFDNQVLASGKPDYKKE